MSHNETARNPRATSNWRTLALIVVIAALAAGLWLLASAQRPVDPAIRARTDNPTATRSGLIGAPQCLTCHPDHGRAHALSGHSRTFARTADSAIAKTLCGVAVPAASSYAGYQYACDEHGLMVSIPERFGDRRFPLEFAFGSGDHATTFLTVLPGLDVEDGVLGIEHRMTWYRSSQRLGITPGQESWIPERDIEHFGKSHQGATLRRCIGCHTTTYEILDGQVQNVVGGVQCEACHGPGEAHAAAAQAEDAIGMRSSIFRPRAPAEEVTLCGRCHRLPDDIDPDRLRRYPPSLTRFQPVGLLQSRCYLESDGRLGCLNCHDAHGPLSSRSAADQTNSCRHCHQQGRDAVCGAGHVTDCVRCHMQRLELIPGIFFHDHWIRARLEDRASADPQDGTTASGEPAVP